MKRVVDRVLVARRRRQATLLSVAGLAVLGIGLFLNFQPSQVLGAYVALLAGTLLSVLGIGLADKWLRRPRPEEALAEALKGGRALALYHWALPAEHVLVAPWGLVVIAVFAQEGPVHVRGARWREARPLWRALFSLGRRPVRDPSAALDAEAAALSAALVADDPALAGVPIERLAVFTFPGVALTVDAPSLPAVRTADLRAWLRDASKRPALPAADRRRLELALDRLAEARMTPAPPPKPRTARRGRARGG